ncbi:MAG TPA: TetR/AcrR family transcriptional regulator [Ktedonobacteraceae bacterium]|nr:TetR/AcrR family transcriptional regulator [Ktedonobacteraceae bacterium]
MTLSEQVKQKAGRPRSDRSHQAILKATLELLAIEGFETMSIEGIAERAGVGKTTIYRRWSSKSDLVIEAIGKLHAELPVIDTGNLRNDLLAMFRNAWQQEGPSIFESLGIHMIGILKTNPEISQAFFNRLFAPRLQQFTHMIERAKARGELQPDVDVVLLVDLFAGPLIARLFFTSLISPPSEQWPEQVIDAILHGIA